MTEVIIRFDKVNSLAHKDQDICGFFKMKAIVVPDVGEVVNIQGNPYIVLDRGFAVGGDDDQMYAYLRMLPAFAGGMKKSKVTG